jgi:hypothetical protein
MPEAGFIEGGYSRQIREVDYLHQYRHDTYGSALQKRGFEQDVLKSQQYSLSRNQKISSETSSNVPSILDLKLKPPELSGASSCDMQHPENKSFFFDVGNQRHGPVLPAQKELDIHVKHGRQADRFSSHAVRDVGSARRDRKSKEFNTHAKHDRLADKQDADIFKRRNDLD